MLIVVEDGDLHRLPQGLLDIETFRSLDIFQVDAAKRRLQDLAGPYNLIGVMRIQFEIKDIDISESLKQDALAFHHGLARQRSNVAQPKHSRPVADDGDEVPLRRIL